MLLAFLNSLKLLILSEQTYKLTNIVTDRVLTLPLLHMNVHG